MMDLSDKVSDQTSESEEMSPEKSPERLSSDCTQLRTCADCGTTKTPLWRGGPAGPKSLCNACGIRSRKKRRALMGINKEDKKPKKSSINKHNTHQINSTSSSYNSTSSEESSSNKYGQNNSLKKKMLTFGGKVASYQRPRSNSINQRKKLGEVEQAAFLLMALSCGSVYA